MRRLVIAAAVLSCCTNSAFADNYSKVAFDAVYNQSSAAGTNQVHMICDGQGHMRTDTNMGGQKMTSIMDYPGHVCYSIMEAQKMVVKAPLKAQADVHDMESAKAANAKSLGTKVINGHPCHGFEYDAAGGKSIGWIGDDINYLVKSESNYGGQKTSMELVSFKKTAPSADQFKVPSNYKVMGVPGAQ
jgi:hypothetical protein